MDAATRGRRPVTDNALVKLSNMWWERAAFILERLAVGTSFTAANQASAGIYDTCHWGEIVSRLARARGNTLGNAARLVHQGKRIVQNEEQRQLLIEQANEIRTTARRLLRLLNKIPVKQGNAEFQPAAESNPAIFDATKPVVFGRVQGQLALTQKFVAKCVRDLPNITAKTTLPLTPFDRSRIALEAERIALGAKLIVWMCERNQLGVVKKPDRNGQDRIGVGRRYSPWLNSLRPGALHALNRRLA